MGTNSTGKMRVLIADDHSIVREGIKYLLTKSDRYCVVGEAVTGVSVVELAERLNPDIIILDLKMPGLSGLEAASRIKKANPQVKIIVLSANLFTASFQRGYQAGILGFVDKESVFEELYKALDAVSQGTMYCCSRVRSLIAINLKNHFDPVKHTLSEYERDLVQMLADGKSVQEIGRFLNKSPKTIDAKRRKVMGQLGLSSLAELTKYAISEGITTAEVLS